MSRNEDDMNRIRDDQDVLREPLPFTIKEFDNRAPVDVRRNCANYDTKYGCLIGKECTMSGDNPHCEYFESAVLGMLNRKKVKKYSNNLPKKQRYCKECGAPVGKGKSYCPDCLSDKKRRKQKQKKKRDSE